MPVLTRVSETVVPEWNVVKAEEAVVKAVPISGTGEHVAIEEGTEVIGADAAEAAEAVIAAVAAAAHAKNKDRI